MKFAAVILLLNAEMRIRPSKNYKLEAFTILLKAFPFIIIIFQGPQTALKNDDTFLVQMLGPLKKYLS